MTEADPVKLILRIAESQDECAFADLFHHYAPRVKSFLVRRGESMEMAEELAQETMLKVWRKAGHFDPTMTNVSGWIFAIARNQKIDAFRRQQRQAGGFELDSMPSLEVQLGEELVLAREREADVRLALSQLSDDEGEIVRLWIYEGQTHSELAQSLNLPLGTVKSKLRRCFTRLRKILDDSK